MSGARFERVRPVRLYQRIVEQIEDALATGRLKSGERLPSEREMVTQFGASRATVREALRVLESNGVVRSRPGDPNGPELLPFTAGQLSRQVRRLAQTEGMTLAQLLASRMILDSAAARMAAVLRTDAELARMAAANQRMRDAVDIGFLEFSEADFAFHEAVAFASHNPLLQVCNEVVRDTLLWLVRDKIAHARNAKASMRRMLEKHELVLHAIRAEDAAAAARAAMDSLYDYYAHHVPKAERAALTALMDD